MLASFHEFIKYQTNLLVGFCPEIIDSEEFEDNIDWLDFKINSFQHFLLT